MKKIFFVNFKTANGADDSPEAISSDGLLYCSNNGGNTKITFYNGETRFCSDSISDLTNGLDLVNAGIVSNVNGSPSNIGTVSFNSDYVDSVYEDGSKRFVELKTGFSSNIIFETSNTFATISQESSYIKTISSPVGDITIDVADPANPVILSELAGNPNVKLLSGVIRNTAGTWAFINDATHEPLRLISISQPNTTDVRVDYDKTYAQVISLTATVDETYAQNGIFVGASVGISNSIIKLFQDNELADFIFYNGSAFVSFSSKFTIGAYASGVLNLTHPNCRNELSAQATIRDDAAFDVRVGSIGATSTVIKFMNPDGTAYTGAATTGMRFYLSRGLYKEAQALTHTASAISGSNIWIIALMLDS